MYLKIVSTKFDKNFEPQFFIPQFRVSDNIEPQLSYLIFTYFFHNINIGNNKDTFTQENEHIQINRQLNSRDIRHSQLLFTPREGTHRERGKAIRLWSQMPSVYNISRPSIGNINKANYFVSPGLQFQLSKASEAIQKSLNFNAN